MVPDIKLKDYYCSYVYDAESDIESYNKEIEHIILTRSELRAYIEKHINVLKDEYGIDITRFDIEWNKEQYNCSKSLNKLIVNTLQNYDNSKNRAVLIQILKYCRTLEDENEYRSLIDLATVRSNITFKDYKKYITKFYTEVHRCVLNGEGYVFDEGIGTFLINYWKLNKSRTKAIIDFAATNKRKREIIAAGLKPYDEEEAMFYKEQGIPYDGVEYKIYRSDGNLYEMTFIDSKVFGRKELDFQRTEYVHAKFRGLSYQQIADGFVKSEDDLINLNVDLRYKLNILIYLEPSKYLKFVRNAEQSKYTY